MAAQHRPGTAVPRKPSPAVYRRRRLVAAVIVLLLIGALVAVVLFVASLFGSETTEGKDQAGTEKAAAQGPQARSGSAAEDPGDGKDDGTGKHDAKDEDGSVDTAKDGDSGDSAKDEDGNGDNGKKADGSSKDDGEAASAEEEDAESTTEPTAEPTANSTCEDSDVAVEASTDHAVYQQGENPVLTLSISNEGDDECTINLGTSEMEYLITSGEDRIFSSTDCQVEATDNYQTLKSGETEKANLTWERIRTTPDCEPVESGAQPGTYTLVTKLGERASEPELFKLE